MKHRATWLLGLLLVSLALSTCLYGQAVSGSITGVITDASGAALHGASVDVVSVGTGVHYKSNSNDAGYFNVLNLISGAYRIDISATGFRPVTRNDVQVDIGAVVRLDFQLEVGTMQERVTVVGEAPLLETDKVEVGSTVTTKSLEALPVEGRNPTALARLQPGVVMNNNGQGIPSAQSSANYTFSVNGQRSQQNRQLLDGVDDTEGVGGGAPIVPMTDALQEYRLVTSNYDVELGQVGGAIQNFTTKSGGNDVHGSAHEFNRVNALFARNPFTEPGGPGHFVWNQFGGTLGGPVKKNKIFLFGYFDAIRVRSAGNVLTTVPTQAFRSGDFSSQLPSHPIYDPLTGGAGGVGRSLFPGNIIPANRLNPIVQNMLSKLPLPTQAGQDNNFLATQINPIDQNLGTIRADYVINDASRFFARYTRQQGNSVLNVPAYGSLDYPGSNVAEGNNNSLVANYTRVVTPNLIIEGRFGWTLNEWKQDAVDQASKTSEQFGIPGLNSACDSCGGLAGFIIGGPVGAFSFGNNDHSHQVDNYGNYNFVGVATWTHGAHSFKFGTDTLLTWRDRRDTSSQGDFGCANTGVCSGNGFSQQITGSPAAPGSGLSIATLLLGDASAFGRVIYARNLPLAHNTRQAFFAQDTWRVTTKLTLTLGLRWDYNGYPTSPQRGGIANFNYSNSNTIISNYGDSTATANVDQNHRDFEPRIGVAYRLTERTVIRTGYARSYAIGFFGANFGAITNDWPNATRQNLKQSDAYLPVLVIGQAPPPFVSGFDVLAAAGNPGQYPTPNSAGFGADRHNPSNSIDMWNFSIQRQLPGDLTVTAGYVGNAVRHIFYRVDYNAAMPGPGTINSRRPFDVFGFDTNAYNQSNQSSTGYQGLQLSTQKRFSKGLLFTTSFTWGKSYDFGSHNPMYNWNANLDRAVQDADRKFVFVASHVWELPFGPGKRFLSGKGPIKHLVGGWQISGIETAESGLPFTPVLGDSSTLNSDCCTLRPNITGDPSVSNRNRNLWFNPKAFSVPALYVFGNSGRNILRGPSLFRVDLSLVKGFQISERTKLELQWEGYNAFNHTNLSNPSATVDGSTAGKITGVTDIMRRLQLSATVRF
jgi:Carboxypeptidase regulatory-like domain/TonB dependent receptor